MSFLTGFFVDFVSLSVAKGFIAGASVIIAVEQLKGLLGLHIDSDSFVMIVYDTFANIAQSKLEVFEETSKSFGCSNFLF